ncbi:MAG: hypothetical protein JNJ54_02680 [Myxococcaceae bacterium]|nr:hypothetical protein [Myxococcaceae bacterium]
MAGRRTWLWGLLAVAGACGVCGAATLLLGLLTASDEGSPSVGEGSPGAAGGFGFAPPQGWKSAGPGRFTTAQAQRSATLGVEVIRLSAIAGRDSPGRKLTSVWTTQVGADWAGASATPLVLRRYVGNGAIAHFTSAVLKPKAGGIDTRVSLYLVEADDRLEPLVILQTYSDPESMAEVNTNHAASFSFDTSSAQVEEALNATQGSPVGVPLAADDELTGAWVSSTSNNLQWLNTFSGAREMTAVGGVTRYELSADHRFTYRYQGGAGNVDAMKFGSDEDQGQWAIERDVLVLTGEKHLTKYLIAGAARAPDGKRTLFMLPHPRWSWAPGQVAQNGQLFEAEE